jgi:hypothetical protein
MDKVTGGAFGSGIEDSIRNIYRFIVYNYEAGDELYLFGFSRGAFTVRTLAGLIADCGLIPAEDYPTEREFSAQTRAAYKAYRRKYKALAARLSPRHGMTADEFKERYARRGSTGRPLDPGIRLLGVWDTVDAVGLPFKLADFWNTVIWRFKFKNTSLSRIVEKGCHALALDDSRESFTPVLWDERDPSAAARVEQVWFAGAHSNVGGGYPQQGTSLVALDWMMQHAERQGLRFTAFSREQFRSQQAFADKLYNPRANLGVFYRWKPRNVTELCAEKGIEVPKVHVSVIERIAQAPEGYAPGNIPPHCAVVATEDDPLLDVTKVSGVIAAAHGGETARPLAEQQKAWVKVGLAAYLSLVFGSLGAVVLALWAGVGTSSSAGDVVAATRPLFDMFPFSLAAAVVRDPIAATVLGSGLTLGYLLSSLSDRRTNQVYSAFWHRHQGALRAAISRTASTSTGTAQRMPGTRVIK